MVYQCLYKKTSGGENTNNNTNIQHHHLFAWLAFISWYFNVTNNGSFTETTPYRTFKEARLCKERGNRDCICGCYLTFTDLTKKAYHLGCTLNSLSLDLPDELYTINGSPDIGPRLMSGTKVFYCYLKTAQGYFDWKPIIVWSSGIGFVALKFLAYCLQIGQRSVILV